MLGKKTVDRDDALPATIAAVWVGTITILPFAIYELLTGAPQTINAEVLGGAAYGGLLVTALGFPVLFWVMKDLSINQVGFLMYLQPLAGVLIAWALLDESLTTKFFIGGAIVFVAVGIGTRADARNAAEKKAA